MLDIISMIIFLVIFLGIPVIMIVIGGNNKTESEEIMEDEEQMKN